MSKTQTFEEMIERLGDLKAEVAEAKETLDVLKSEETALKQAVLDEMRARHSKRSEAVSGFYAVRVKSNKNEVDTYLASEYILANNDLDRDAFFNLNKPNYLRWAKETFEKNGEVVPGIAIVEGEYLTIKEEK